MCILVPEVFPPPQVLGDIVQSAIISYSGIAIMCNYIFEEVLDKVPGAGSAARVAIQNRKQIRFFFIEEESILSIHQ